MPGAIRARILPEELNLYVSSAAQKKARDNGTLQPTPSAVYNGPKKKRVYLLWPQEDDCETVPNLGATLGCDKFFSCQVHKKEKNTSKMAISQRILRAMSD